MSTDQSVKPGAAQLEGRPVRRVGSVLIGLVLIVLKTEAYAKLLTEGRLLVLVILGFTAVIALLRGRPLRMATAGGVFVGVAAGLPSVWLDIGIGAGAVVVLTAVLVAVGTLLQRLDRRSVG